MEERNGTYIIKAEVYEEGIDMWLGSQGDALNILEIKKMMK